MVQSPQFGLADFAVFGAMLALSVFIGIYYAFKDRKSSSIENYYFGGRKMSFVPVALSIAVTFVSSVAVLAFPSHVYVYGTIVTWYAFAVIPQAFIACVYYIPLFYRLQLSSVYEYLELRYHRGVRLLTSIMIIALMVSYMASTLYLTALSLSAVTPMSLTVSIVLTSFICTGYTTIGGMKAVVWNDVLQSVIMVSGMVAVMVQSIVSVGGPDKVFEALARGGRNTLWNFEVDITVQQTFWTIMIGNAIGWASCMCMNQVIVQRYQSCKSAGDAKKAAILAAIPMILMSLIALVTGCAMYAYFEGCDPVESGQLDKADQAVAYLAVILFQSAPGMAGLFVAAAYSGNMSTVSSGINSLAAMTLEDFIIPHKPHMKSSSRLTISKVLSILFGLVTMVFSFLMEYMSATIVQIVATLFGVFGGPIMGIYAIGIHFPWTNKYGASCGLVSGVLLSLWMAMGGVIYPPHHNGILPVSVDNCTYEGNYSIGSNFANTSSVQQTTQPITSAYNYESERPAIADTLYSVSFLYVGVVGMFVTVLIAMVVTLLTGKNDPEDMDPELFLPLLDNKIFPKQIRKFFRFGVPECKEDFSEELSEKPNLLKDHLLITATDVQLSSIEH